mgnify:CR=1 FL=1
MNKFIKILFIFLISANCSLHKSKFWTKIEVIEEEKSANKVKIFAREENLNLEINPSLKISLYTKPINRSFFNNFDNNNGRINYDGNLKNISKFKFSKIANFNQYDPSISFENENVIFFDNKGSLLKFDKNSNLIWKKNHYSKREKKLNPILQFSNNNEVLIVGDNISKYYAMDISDGKLKWLKNHTSPFNSQIKIFKDRFFIIDFENTLRCFSVKDGSEIWSIKTEDSLVRSQKKLSFIIIDEKIYFNNSLGDISAVDIQSGELLWLRPTQSKLVYDEGFFVKTSDLIADNESIYFSNNKNRFYSLEINTGTLNWMQSINSNLRPTLIDKYVFTVSLEGYLIVIDKISGKIIRSTDVFRNFKPKKRSKILPVGFIVGINKIYLTTDNGKLLIIDTTTGITTSTLKIAKDKISRPFVLNQNLYIIKDNSIIKLN